MNSVISDTTALIILAKSDILSFLSNLFQDIYIPRAVYDELVIKNDIVKYRIEKFEAISVKEVNDLITLRRIKWLNIDKGETEAISLALELDLMIVIDEKKGRRIALGQGLKIVGLLGILIENYKRGFISFGEAEVYFSVFKEQGLRIDDKLEKLFFQRLKSA